MFFLLDIEITSESSYKVISRAVVYDRNITVVAHAEFGHLVIITYLLVQNLEVSNQSS